MKKFNQGDKNAFLEMHNYYAPKIFRHIYYRIGSKEAAQDTTQQVFFKVWEYIVNSDNKIDNLNAFIYRTANNLVTDYYRKSERKNLALDDIAENKLATEPSYISEVDQGLEIAKIKKALLSISTEHQQLIVWRYLDDLSIGQIAELSNKSRNAIYVCLHRALKELKNNPLIYDQLKT
ncbi:MAG: RNA polymerase sigma factor [bacterium]|nr:RNA polymerase sigma factor [bacterium]